MRASLARACGSVAQRLPSTTPRGAACLGPLAPLPSAAVRLDFSALPPEARMRDRKNKERWERERLAEIDDLKSDIGRLAPNLKARPLGPLRLFAHLPRQRLSTPAPDGPSAAARSRNLLTDLERSWPGSETWLPSRRLTGLSAVRMERGALCCAHCIWRWSPPPPAAVLQSLAVRSSEPSRPPLTVFMLASHCPLTKQTNSDGCMFCLQAVEQYEAVREKEREQLEELEGARRESRVRRGRPARPRSLVLCQPSPLWP